MTTKADDKKPETQVEETKEWLADITRLNESLASLTTRMETLAPTEAVQALTAKLDNLATKLETLEKKPNQDLTPLQTEITTLREQIQKLPQEPPEKKSEKKDPIKDKKEVQEVVRARVATRNWV